MYIRVLNAMSKLTTYLNSWEKGCPDVCTQKRVNVVVVVVDSV